jgi:hypothetical protein
MWITQAVNRTGECFREKSLALWFILPSPAPPLDTYNFTVFLKALGKKW